ncbi:MAG: adenylate/guanylate cyclase domain-containing protein [bacterium]
MTKRFFHGCLIGLAAAAIAYGCWLAGWLNQPENMIWRWRVGVFAAMNPPSGQIKVILLDQNSLDWGKAENRWSWPWPREVYGPIFSFCKRGGARSIAFDWVFTEPSVYQAADDEALGAAFRSVNSSVGAVFLGRKSGAATNWPAGIPARRLVIRGLDNWLARDHADELCMPRASFPVLEVATNATLLADVSGQVDDDGINRRIALFQVFDGQPVPSLGLAAYLAGTPPEQLKIEPGWLTIGSKRVPIDHAGRTILYYRGNTGTHQSFSAASIIQSELRLQEGGIPPVAPSVFKDAYVFFGSSAEGLMDLRPTPVSKVLPGVEIHATALDNLLSSLFLRDVSKLTTLWATVLLGLFSGMLVIFCRKAWQSIVAFAICLPLPVVIGFAAYAYGFWWQVAIGEVATLLALIGAVIFNYATEGRQKAFIKSAFRYYLGPAVIEQVIADPARLQLGGEKRELTMFFSDIEKFSSFSEKLDPVTLTSLLNEYLSDMTDIILEEGGYLDKYIGDAIVAYWNAPLSQPDHAVRACRAVLRCQRRLAEKRESYKQRTGVTIKARIGVNTGVVIVGNMGSRNRFNYTVLGDAANLASRLEGANKAFGTYAMISEATWSRTGGRFIGRELGRIRVVGREKPVRVYEIMGFAGEALPCFIPEYERAMKLCDEGKWGEALKILDNYSDDSACAIYADKCRILLSDPSQKWDGVWSLTEK